MFPFSPPPPAFQNRPSFHKKRGSIKPLQHPYSIPFHAAHVFQISRLAPCPPADTIAHSILLICLRNNTKNRGQGMCYAWLRGRRVRSQGCRLQYAELAVDFVLIVLVRVGGFGKIIIYPERYVQIDFRYPCVKHDGQLTAGFIVSAVFYFPCEFVRSAKHGDLPCILMNAHDAPKDLYRRF